MNPAAEFQYIARLMERTDCSAINSIMNLIYTEYIERYYFDALTEAQKGLVGDRSEILKNYLERVSIREKSRNKSRGLRRSIILLRDLDRFQLDKEEIIEGYASLEEKLIQDGFSKGDVSSFRSFVIDALERYEPNP